MNLMATTQAAWVFGLVGLIVGAGLSWAVMSRRVSHREARLVAAAREQMALNTQNIRAANAKLQAELDKERATPKPTQQMLLDQQRALVLQLQSQLRLAHTEIDQLAKASGRPAETGPITQSDPMDSDGFALTRPFER